MIAIKICSSLSDQNLIKGIGNSSQIKIDYLTAKNYDLQQEVESYKHQISYFKKRLDQYERLYSEVEEELKVFKNGRSKHQYEDTYNNRHRDSHYDHPHHHHKSNESKRERIWRATNNACETIKSGAKHVYNFISSYLD